MSSSSTMQPLSDSWLFRATFRPEGESSSADDDADAIVLCSGCYREVPWDASVCPHCHREIPRL